MYPLVTPQQRGCRTQSCPHCGSAHFKKNGFFTRCADSRHIQRYVCKGCRKSFSRAGYTHWYRYQHRRLNPWIQVLLVNSGTLRGIGRILKIQPDTVARHLEVQALLAREELEHQLAKAPKATHVQMDDLITIEHTKLKQVSITLVSDADRYRMLGACVSRIPTSGTNAEKAREKYGPRPDESIENRNKLLERLAPFIAENAKFVTDEHTAYPPIIQTHCPNRNHQTHSSRKACVAGQGEMKEGGFDPLFCINHQLASFRALISRLVRRTWTTTKNIERLGDHVVILMAYYNRHRRPKSALDYEAQFDGADAHGR